MLQQGPRNSGFNGSIWTHGFLETFEFTLSLFTEERAQGSELLTCLDVQELWTHQLKSIVRALLNSENQAKCPWSFFRFLTISYILYQSIFTNSAMKILLGHVCTQGVFFSSSSFYRLSKLLTIYWESKVWVKKSRHSQKLKIFLNSQFLVNPYETLSKIPSHGYLMLLENQLDWIKIVDVLKFSISESVSSFFLLRLLCFKNQKAFDLY